jgi:hypothetical protein
MVLQSGAGVARLIDIKVVVVFLCFSPEFVDDSTQEVFEDGFSQYKENKPEYTPDDHSKK